MLAQRGPSARRAHLPPGSHRVRTSSTLLQSAGRSGASPHQFLVTDDLSPFTNYQLLLSSHLRHPTASQASQRSTGSDRIGLASEAALHGFRPHRPRKRGNAPRVLTSYPFGARLACSGQAFNGNLDRVRLAAIVGSSDGVSPGNGRPIKSLARTR